MKFKPLKNTITLLLTGCMFCAFLFNTTKCITTSSSPSQLKKFDTSTVAIIQSKKERTVDIDENEILSMVREAVELAGGFKNIISDGDVVVLKPNLVTIKDYTLPGWQGKPLSPEANGTTTDWRITKAAVYLVREVNPSGKVYIMEGSSISTTEAFKHYKYTHEYIPGVDDFIAIEKDSGQFGDRMSSELVKVPLNEGLYRNEYYVNKRFMKANVVISLPCLKNHWHAVVSGAIKNLAIGATPASIYGVSTANNSRINMVNHDSINLHEWIHDYYMVRPADFVIMDGLQGIQNGPTPSFEVSRSKNIAKDQMNMRLIIAGTDAVAVDTIEALLMGWDPLSVQYLRFLNQDNVGNLDTSCIDIKGMEVDLVRKNFSGKTHMHAVKGKVIKDKEAPEVEIKNALIENGVLHLSIKPETDLNKIKLFLNGKQIDSLLTKEFEDIVVNLDESFTNTENLTIYAYDQVLNRREINITLPYTGKGVFVARKATSAPVINGLADDKCWDNVNWYPIESVWLGEKPVEKDFKGNFKITWTKDNLYLLVAVTDDILLDSHTNPTNNYWNDDCLEFFIDEDASGGNHQYNYNAFAYHISLSNDIVDLHTDQRPTLYNDHINVKRSQQGNVSLWECAIDIYNDSFILGGENKTVLLAKGKNIGFMVAYCDSDHGDQRESFIGSVDINKTDKNVGWITADVFGTLILTE